MPRLRGDTQTAGMPRAVQDGLMKCSVCGQTKDQTDFYLRPDTHKYRKDCIDCCKKRSKKSALKYQDVYKERSKQYYEANKELVSEKNKQWAQNNRERKNEINRKYYQNHKEQKNLSAVQWQRENKDKLREIKKREHQKNRERYKLYHNEYTKNQYKNNPSYRVKINISSAINSSLHGRKNHRTWPLLVGYSVNDLMKHLENKFKDGMTWCNYGRVWHIDHIIPISAFNIESYDSFDFKRCWNLQNLQPLFASENLRKHNKLNQPFQPCLL